MTDQARTLLAGLVAGVVIVPPAATLLLFDTTAATMAAVFVILASLLLSRAGISPLTLSITWAGAVATFIAMPAMAGASEDAVSPVPEVLVGVVLGSFAVTPWLILLAFIRHALTPTSSRPSYKMKDLHS